MTAERPGRAVPPLLRHGLWLVAAWVIPLGLLLILLPLAQHVEEAATGAPDPDVVTVGSRTDTVTLPVTVAVGYGTSVPVTVNIGGMVTRVHHPEVVGNGTPLIDLDATTVIAVTGDVPPHRDLRPGDTGEDVRVVAELLAELDLLEPDDVDDRFGPAVRRAVCAYRDVVLDMPDGCDGVFRLAWTAYVPPGATVTAVDLAPGQRVESGATVATTTAPVEAVTFTPTTPDRTTDHLVGRAVVLTAPDGATLWVPEFPGPTAPLAAFVTDHAPPEVLDPATSRAGFTLAVADPQTVGVIPAVSLFVTPDGTACVFEAGPSLRAIEVPAVAARGEIGSLQVPADLIGVAVVRNPLTLDPADRALCGS